jgi:dual specificity MAP kinase phosphatase
MMTSKLPRLIEQHEMLDIPSHVLFPWLHGISDDGQKGRDMGCFFGHAPPFQPPAYRGLCVLLAPPHPLDTVVDPLTPEAQRPITPLTPLSPDQISRPMVAIPRERSETMSTSSESYRSTTTTEATSPSVDDADADVQMHPCESKRVSAQAKAEGLDTINHPLPCDDPVSAPSTSASSSSMSSDSEDSRPSCILLNSLHLSDVLELPPPITMTKNSPGSVPNLPRFRQAKLPQQINLRNLNIQQIKYATISDLVIYAKGGVGAGVLEMAEQVAVAQEQLWRVRMEEYFALQARGEGEGLGEPVRYGVWVVVGELNFALHQRNRTYDINRTVS